MKGTFQALSLILEADLTVLGVDISKSKMLLFALENHRNVKAGYAWPSYETLAREIGCSRRTVITLVADLCAAGVIMKGKRIETRTRRKSADPGKRQTSNAYWISYKRLRELVPDDELGDVLIDFPSPEQLEDTSPDASLEGCKSCTPNNGGVQNLHPRGCEDFTPGGARIAPEPVNRNEPTATSRTPAPEPATPERSGGGTEAGVAEDAAAADAGEAAAADAAATLAGWGVPKRKIAQVLTDPTGRTASVGALGLMAVGLGAGVAVDLARTYGEPRCQVAVVNALHLEHVGEIRSTTSGYARKCVEHGYSLNPKAKDRMGERIAHQRKLRVEALQHQLRGFDERALYAASEAVRERWSEFKTQPHPTSSSASERYVTAVLAELTNPQTERKTA